MKVVFCLILTKICHRAYIEVLVYLEQYLLFTSFCLESLVVRYLDMFSDIFPIIFWYFDQLSWHLFLCIDLVHYLVIPVCDELVSLCLHIWHIINSLIYYEYLYKFVSCILYLLSIILFQYSLADCWLHWLFWLSLEVTFEYLPLFPIVR